MADDGLAAGCCRSSSTSSTSRSSNSTRIFSHSSGRRAMRRICARCSVSCTRSRARRARRDCRSSTGMPHIEHGLSQVRDSGQALGGAQIALLFEAADALGETRDELRLGRVAPEPTLSAVLHHASGRRAPVPPARPVVPGVERTEEAVRTTSQVRVSLHQVEEIAGAAGEIAGLASVLSDRAYDLAALRSRRRAERRGDTSNEGGAALDRELTRLLKHAGEDARALSSSPHGWEPDATSAPAPFLRACRDAAARRAGHRTRCQQAGSDRRDRR